MRHFRYRWLILPTLIALAALCLWLWPRVAEPPREPIYTLPTGTQLLTYPFEDSVITAGYQNPRYAEKMGYAHYGTDLVMRRQGRAEVLASGAGAVLGVENCDNSLGHIAVIRYSNVYNPTTRETADLIVRYYHMDAIEIDTGDTVTAGQRIGFIDSAHESHNHVHFEVDTDLAHPFHTPQVSERSSELLVRFPATGESLVNPVSVLVSGDQQKAAVHPHSDCCAPSDIPQYFTWQFAPEPT